jgi:hypothetical protein
MKSHLAAAGAFDLVQQDPGIFATQSRGEAFYQSQVFASNEEPIDLDRVRRQFTGHFLYHLLSLGLLRF